ncbi:MAG: energy transducer TonB [Chromatiaceae bacterium]|nr:energy transducer TonB [Chromatiaceae bacterium]
MSPRFCSSCIGLGLLVSALVHGLALSLVLNLEPPIPVPGAEAVTELDLTLFAATVATEPLPSFAEPPLPSEPESEPEPTPEPEPESEPTPEPEPEPEPTPEPEPEPIVAQEVVPPEAFTPPPVEKPKPKPKPKLPPKPRKKPEPHQPAARPAAPAPRADQPQPSAPAGTAAVAREEGSSRERAQAEGAYLAELQRAIKRQQGYPEAARHRGAAGTTTLTFVLQADGHIDRVRVARSAGDSDLDQAAVEAINRLGRFKPIPSVLGRDSWTLRIPIRFDLR